MIFYRRGRRELRGAMGFYRSELRGGMIFFTAEDAESAEGHGFLPQKGHGKYSPIFLCHISLRSSAPSSVYTLFLIFKALFMGFYHRGGMVVIHQSFYAIFLCVSPRPLRFILSSVYSKPYLWVFNHRVQRVQGSYSPIFLCLFLLCVLRALCGLYSLPYIQSLIYGFLTTEYRGFKVIILQSFYAYFSSALSAPSAVYTLFMGF